MANRYVYSGAGGSNNGSSWADAHTSLSGAISAGAAGDTYWIAHDHNDAVNAALNLSGKGTLAAPDRYLCVNRAGSVPPVAADLTTGAVVSSSGASAGALTLNGFCYSYGITYAAGIGATGLTNLNFAGIIASQVYEKCTMRLGTSSAGARISPNDNGDVLFINSTLQFNSVSQGIQNAGQVRFVSNENTNLIPTGSIPTNLVPAGSVPNRDMSFYGYDLSALGSGKTIFAAPQRYQQFLLRNCKLDASVTICATSTTQRSYCDVIGCSSTSNPRDNRRIGLEGTLTTEETIVRTGGASNGTPFSWKIVSTSNNKEDFPFITWDGTLFNTATGSAKTLTVHVVTDNVTLTDAEIWLEVDYLEDAGYPMGAVLTDRRATRLTTAANQASSSETWTTTGLGTPIKQKLEVTFTPQMAGPITWRVCYAKASSTVYVCPKAELS